MSDYSYHRKFPREWLWLLREELYKEFPDYGDEIDLAYDYLPPVVTHSFIGRLAEKLPSKPQGITLGGVVYLTPHYARMRNKIDASRGAAAAKVYEFGMFAHETYHAIDQELTKDFPLLKGSGKWKWLIKYIGRLVITPNAYTHPMEIPAYEMHKYLKKRAEAENI